MTTFADRLVTPIIRVDDDSLGNDGSGEGPTSLCRWSQHEWATHEAGIGEAVPTSD